jgi:hypothetical protein
MCGERAAKSHASTATHDFVDFIITRLKYKYLVKPYQKENIIGPVANLNHLHKP